MQQQNAASQVKDPLTGVVFVTICAWHCVHVMPIGPLPKERKMTTGGAGTT